MFNLDSKFIEELKLWLDNFQNIDSTESAIEICRYMKNYNLIQQLDIEPNLRIYLEEYIKPKANIISIVIDQLKNMKFDDFNTCIKQLYTILAFDSKYLILINEHIFCKLLYKVIHNDGQFTPHDIVELYKQDQEQFMNENRKFFDWLKSENLLNQI